eukprot:352987-Chlamydomonas_euryale.AAC.13
MEGVGRQRGRRPEKDHPTTEDTTPFASACAQCTLVANSEPTSEPGALGERLSLHADQVSSRRTGPWHHIMDRMEV